MAVSDGAISPVNPAIAALSPVTEKEAPAAAFRAVANVVRGPASTTRAVWMASNSEETAAKITAHPVSSLLNNLGCQWNLLGGSPVRVVVKVPSMPLRRKTISLTSVTKTLTSVCN
jgi:hypothetical protein